jgi:hypothetical protein
MGHRLWRFTATSATRQTGRFHYYFRPQRRVPPLSSLGCNEDHVRFGRKFILMGDLDNARVQRSLQAALHYSSEHMARGVVGN